MPRRKYPWTALDYAASLSVVEMMTARSLNPYDIVEQSDGQLRYNRVRDITKADKAPVRISEFVLICEITGYSPIEMFAKVCQDAQNIRLGHLMPEWTCPDGEQRKPAQEELTRPPVLDDPLIAQFTASRENPELEIRAVKRP